MDGLLERFFDGNTAAAARLISIVENDSENSQKVLDAVFPKVRGAYKIGFTGPPGAGKSTLVSRLARIFRQEGRAIGVIAVDPTSPFSGGALLGDRIRMQKLTEDPEIFVRSLATRGSLGGISRCTNDVADLLDAFGKDLILVETVGVGQSELEIAEKAHTVVVVLVPESGDSIQAMKAGLMEIGDIFVMNKSDHPDAELAARDLEDTLRLKDIPEDGWRPPVLLTSALEGAGLETLEEKIKAHYDYLERNGILDEKRRRVLRSRIWEALLDRVEERLAMDKEIAELIDRRMEDVLEKKIAPYSIVREIEKMIDIVHDWSKEDER